VASSCEHGNGPSGHVYVGEFFNELIDLSLLKKDSAK
jgi:hypothetical protein